MVVEDYDLLAGIGDTYGLDIRSIMSGSSIQNNSSTIRSKRMHRIILLTKKNRTVRSMAEGHQGLTIK